FFGGKGGVGKTVLASAIASHLGRRIFRVDGDERYTEQKLSGWFDPPVVLEKGYVAEAFMPGPLTEAMRTGGVLFVNEMNRMPEGVQNILLPAMDEGMIDVPKVGRVDAQEGFVVVATQNPREFVATTSLSEALSDRFELLLLDYQPEAEELEILNARFSEAPQETVRCCLWIARRTRNHHNIRRGASIRAAMSMVQLLGGLSGDVPSTVRKAAHMALPTRIELREESRATMPEVIDQIVDECLSEDIAARPVGGKEEPKDGPDTAKEERGDRKRVDISDFVEVLEAHGQAPAPGDNDIGWKIAQNYQKIRLRLTDPMALEMARRIAIRATIQRVLRLLGPVTLPTRITRGPFSHGDEREVDIESTIENIVDRMHIQPSDIIVEGREPRRISVALMLDASLSMSGDKLAMATAAIAVLALRLKMVDFLVITFNDRSKVVKRIDEDTDLDRLILSFLEFNASGYTNIEEALRSGSRELARSETSDQIGILITDGNYTVGRDPAGAASSFKKLFVIMTESHDCRLSVCESIASSGRGRVFPVSEFDEIPRTLYRVLRVVGQGSRG
ncbi:TPA: AAA domain-containing protein, partial [Thermoplasmata archaeon]|nr:AAA domain-containing protein [Thermoplasmata archaeon]